MLRIRWLLVIALLGVLAPVAIRAQAGAPPSADADDRVLNAPYSARRHFTYLEKSADGKIKRTETHGSEARDSEGRTYSADESLWTYLGVLKSEMLYRNHDPVANTDTSWDSGSKEAKVIHYPPAVPGEDASKAFCLTACLESRMVAAGDAVLEKLGTKTIEGVSAEGTRTSYTVPAGQDHNDQPIVVVHESWYCPELKIVILDTTDDPRTGTSRNELVDIVRGEPDVSKYLPPADYVVHDIQMPQ
jgi:hypothetical protein